MQNSGTTVQLDKFFRMRAFSPFFIEEASLLSKELSSGKSKGTDGIPSEVFKFATVKVLNLISSSFTLFKPAQLMRVMIIPIIKIRVNSRMVIIALLQTQPQHLSFWN